MIFYGMYKCKRFEKSIKHSVAEKIDEIISVENPPNCVGGIREF
jgi:hypothetical protein